MTKGGSAWFTVDMEPVNKDEGQLLIASSSFSTSQPKK
jgi:hypothetical protein